MSEHHKLSIISAYPLADITGVVLAGGRGQRMGGIDKGLQPLAGQPMAAYAIAALKAQCARVVISANRNLAAYAAFGCEVIQDQDTGFLGPLSGMASALAIAATPLTLFVPCDSPLISTALGRRLWAAKIAAGKAIAVAADEERYHPVFALMDSALAANAAAYLQSGARKIDRWFDTIGWVTADCADIAYSFLNINRIADKEKLERRLTPPSQLS
ncbi:MAG: molybdenum cofactor guanylyltransferase [Gammaproteobacteria bacterium]|nr:molybdenum cofactor guanylyltransferase [Gammaproteobacteria bacterium]